MIPRWRCVNLVASLLLALTGWLAVSVADVGRWDPALLAILLVLTIGADFVDINFGPIQIAGSFLGLMLGMALLGPAQAAALGVVSSIVWLVREPTRTPFALSCALTYAAGPLLGGLVLRELAAALDVTVRDLGFVAPLAAGFTVAHVLNFSVMFAVHRFLDGVSIRSNVRTVIVPLLPSEAAMVILASVIVYAEAHVGPLALAMLVVLFFLYLHLLRELTLSQERATELETRGRQLASLQVGVLTAMLRTLSMRDQMTARHSAAVARYTREIAKAAGLSEEEQDLAHTAGLLHDIGKFILPDHILLANTRLDDEDWQTIRMHPYQGAKVVREVEGYGPVADIIWCHHERVDGAGYPRGLSGEDIPLISRMISIADTYDVMTARDSYRDPVSSQAAIEELRRVSGAQLDGRLVEIFVGVLESKGVAFRHADDADFEAELSFERRVRDYAAPRTAEPLPAAA